MFFFALLPFDAISPWKWIQRTMFNSYFFPLRPNRWSNKTKKNQRKLQNTKNSLAYRVHVIDLSEPENSEKEWKAFCISLCVSFKRWIRFSYYLNFIFLAFISSFRSWLWVRAAWRSPRRWHSVGVRRVFQISIMGKLLFSRWYSEFVRGTKKKKATLKSEPSRWIFYFLAFFLSI